MEETQLEQIVHKIHANNFLNIFFMIEFEILKIFRQRDVQLIDDILTNSFHIIIENKQVFEKSI